MLAKDLLKRPYAAWLSYLHGDIDDAQMEEAVGHACDEIERLRAALEKLIVAVVHEVPPIAMGHGVRYRARFLMRCAKQARAALAGGESR